MLVDTAALVIGVLLGLRVDAWSESRQDRVDEHDFLLRLHENWRPPSILLSGKYPNAIQAQSCWDKLDNTVRLRWNCDLPAMRDSQGFLNDFAVNVDGYDALYRSSIQSEWNQLTEVHRLVDWLLEIDHATRR